MGIQWVYKGIQGVYKGYTKGIQGLYKGYQGPTNTRPGTPGTS